MFLAYVVLVQVVDQPLGSLHHERFADLLQRQPEEIFAELLGAVRQTVEFDDLGQGFFSPHAQRAHAELPRQLLVVSLQNFAQDFPVDAHCVQECAVDIKDDVSHRFVVFLRF